MKKIAIAVTLTAGLLTLGACSSDKAESDVVVKTKAGDITKEEFYNELKDRYGEQVLREMVTIEVLNDKYKITDKEVDERIKEIKEQLGDQFDMVLQQQGIQDEAELKKVIKVSMLQEAAVTEDIKVTDEEIKEQYEKETTEIEAQHILVEDEETANKIKKDLDEGADFAKLAKDNSMDEENKDKGGDLGFFGFGDMVPEFFDAAYKIEAGKISEPVKSSYGYHVIKVNDKRKKENAESLEDRKEDIRRELVNEKIDPMEAQAKIAGILKEAKINVKINEFKDLFKDEG